LQKERRRCKQSRLIAGEGKVQTVERLYCKRPIQCLASSKILKILTTHPLTARQECTPPPLVRGEDTLAGWRGGRGVNILEDARHCSVLYICKYFVVQTITCMGIGQPSYSNGRMAAVGPREGAPARRPIQIRRLVRLHGGSFVGWPLFCGRYTVKKVSGFPDPSRDVTDLPAREYYLIIPGQGDFGQ
jgi:hypothetical protein